MRSSSKFVGAYLVFFLGLIVMLFVFRQVTDNQNPQPPLTSVTEIPIITGVVKSDTVCYFGDNLEYKITISSFVIVQILEQEETGNAVKVKINDAVDCWLNLSSLELMGNLEDVPVSSDTVIVLPTQIVSSTPTSLPLALTNLPPTRLLIRWRLESYDCKDGDATGVIVGLDVSGGIPPYYVTPQMPIFAKPGQTISITVESSTSDGKPNGIISFKVPDATDNTIFRCDKDGSVQVLEVPVTPIEPQPETEPICYNPQGHQIPCKKP